MKYAIGLDIGIASVGWAVLELDEFENPYKIFKLGSRIFDAAENPKNGASLALPRREKRSMRRRFRRHKHRLERIKNLLLTAGIVSEEQLLHLYDGKLSDIYELRVRALDERVTDEEMARILLHLAQRRGFKSNRKAEAADKEQGKLLMAVSENAKRMEAHHYRTVGEMFYKDETFAKTKRNKEGQYLTTVHRDMIAEEARLIAETQIRFGNKKLAGDFLDCYLGILLSQRQFDEGPGGDSPYAGNQIENMIGKCTFEKDELRAAKATYSFERFNLLQKVNHLRLIVNEETVALSEVQRKKIIDLAYEKADLKYTQIRKALDLDESVRFNTVTYSDTVAKSEAKAKFNFVSAYHEIRKNLDKIEKGRIKKLSVETLDEIGRILTTYKGDDKRMEELGKLDLTAEEKGALLSISNFSKFGHLSVKALRKINPFLEQGMIYNEACAAAGYDFRGHDHTERCVLLPANGEEMGNITSPVARRAISQTIKVINAIIRMMKESPVYINIELAREMAKDFNERKEIQKANDENQAKNDRIMERLRTEFHIARPTGMDLLKLKLWEEQQGISPYSQKNIQIERLFEHGYADIDHIIPYSICFDDGFKNKILVFSSENREKGNRLPIAYLRAKYGQDAVDKFTVFTETHIKDYRKRQKLLKKVITDDDRNTFKERNLQDTKTISRFMYNYIRDYLLFAPSDTGKKKRVTAVNGAVTAYLRKRWGIRKVREDGDTHHAVDAVVIACATDKLIKELSTYSEYCELEYVVEDKESLMVNTRTGEVKNRFPLPWIGFREELMAWKSDNPAVYLRNLNLESYRNQDFTEIKPIFVSRMPRHKVTGAAHKDTVRSAKHLDEGIVISKKKLKDLKLDKNGEIEGYYNPDSDRELYCALKKRLTAFGGDAEKAFAEDFYKPSEAGKTAPLVKKVKICEKSTLVVPVQQKTAVADNDSMVRVDVFYVEGDGYYLVPIYVADTLKSELPNKAIIGGKSYEKWKEMKEEDFLFSLYPNDLIRIVSKKGVKMVKVNKDSNRSEIAPIKEVISYYRGTDISTASILGINQDNAYKFKSLGVKTLVCLEKYQVDVLGNYSKVKKETRMRFHKG